MDTNSLLEKIEKLGEELLLADLADLQGLANVHSIFQQIQKEAEQNSFYEVSQVALACANLIEKIILNEVSNPNEALNDIGKGISILQALIRDNKPLSECVIPESLLNCMNGYSQTSESAKEQKIEPTYPKPSYSPIIDENIFTEFVSRQPLVLENMERLLLELNEQNRDSNKAEFRRLIHTLKGESGLVGLADVERLCHVVEDTIDNQPFSKLVDTLLEVKDWLQKYFESLAKNLPLPAGVDNLIIKLKKIGTEADQESAPLSAPPSTKETEKTAPAPTSRVLTADPDLLKEFVTESKEHLQNADVNLLTVETDPQNQEALNAVFRAFHTIKGVAGFLDLPEIQSLAHEAENLLDRARKNELTLIGPYMDITFETVDMMKRLVNHVADSLSSGAPLPIEENLPDLMERLHKAVQGTFVATAKPLPVSSQGKKIGEILVNIGKIKPEDLKTALEEQKNLKEHSKDKKAPKIGEILIQEGKVSAPDVALALRAQKQPQPQMVEVKEPVRVDPDRLDRLVDLIGELVIAESMVTQSQELLQNASNQLLRHLNQLDKITRELQEIGMSLRMVAVRATFQKMARLVRDLSRKANKEIRFEMYGEDTELDKSVVDKIGDPLVHMVRNAVDHGIESNPAERIAMGKPPAGLIVLRAYHSGGNICIEVQDDGQGLNKEAILRKAIEKGLIREGENLSEREIYNLIFEPGFSTAKAITDVSGRGVGMDVVKKNIEALRGQIEIHTEKGKGTLFTIRLPLTLAIIDGMVLRVGKERYIVPTLSVVRAIRPSNKDLLTVLNRGEMLSLQGMLIPMFRLNQLFSVEHAETDPSHALVIIVEEDGRQAGFMVDELLGQQQIVIKSLGDAMRGIPGISGGAIMSDGTVGLILDVPGLMRLASNTETFSLS